MNHVTKGGNLENSQRINSLPYLAFLLYITKLYVSNDQVVINMRQFICNQ